MSKAKPATVAETVRTKQEWSHLDHNLVLGKSNGPICNAEIKVWEASWDEVRDTVSEPEIGSKDGSYITRCAFAGNRRNNGNALVGFLAILDGDSTIDIDTGEFTQGAPDPHRVNEVLADHDVTHVLFSSHSNQQEDKGHRYRVLLPVHLESEEELELVVAYVTHLLQTDGVHLANVRENNTFAQGWYLPRVPNEKSREHFVYLEHDGAEPFPMNEAEAWWEEHQPNAELPYLVDESDRKATGEGIIDNFNQHKGPDWILPFLLAEGYAYVGQQAGPNRRPSYRLKAPQSTSGSSGVILYYGDIGRWLVYSHHGDHDPLSIKAHDAFALLTRFKFKGSMREAVMHLEATDKPKPKEKPLYMGINQILKERLEWNWVVEDLLLAGRVYQVHGQWKAGKSLVSLDLSLHLAQGKDWNGQRVQQCLVVYVAGEAEIDIRARIKAFEMRHGLESDCTFVLRCLPVYFCDKEQTDKLRKDIKNTIIPVWQEGQSMRAHQIALDASAELDRALPKPPPLVVVIDTLARNFGPGRSESSDTDMGAFINNVVDRIARPLEATTLIVHHPGHGEKDRGRGHSSLPGAVDGTLGLVNNNGTVTLQTMEMRNIPTSSNAIGWTIEGVDLQVNDNFGKSVNAPVLTPAGQVQVLNQTQRRAVDARETAKEAIFDWLKGIALRRNAEPQNPVLYPSTVAIKDEVIGNQGNLKNATEDAIKVLKQAGGLVTRALPDHIKISGRNSYIDLGTVVVGGPGSNQVESGYER